MLPRSEIKPQSGTSPEHMYRADVSITTNWQLGTSLDQLRALFPDPAKRIAPPSYFERRLYESRLLSASSLSPVDVAT